MCFFIEKRYETDVNWNHHHHHYHHHPHHHHCHQKSQAAPEFTLF